MEMLHLKVVTPEGSGISVDTVSFTARSSLGEFNILPNHRRVIMELVAGQMTVVESDGNKHLYAYDSGFLEAGPDHVNILTAHCEKPDDVPVDEATRLQDEFQKRLDVALESGDAESLEIQKELNWQKARLSII